MTMTMIMTMTTLTMTMTMTMTMIIQTITIQTMEIPTALHKDVKFVQIQLAPNVFWTQMVKKNTS